MPEKIKNTITKERKPAIKPAKISEGQWTPQKILKKTRIVVKIIKTNAQNKLYGKRVNDKAKNAAEWPEGKEGWFGFLISWFTVKTSMGLFLL